MALRVGALIAALVATVAVAFVALFNNMSMLVAGGAVLIAVMLGYLAAVLALVAAIVIWRRPDLARRLLLIVLVMSLIGLAAVVPEYSRLAAERGRPLVVQISPNLISSLLAAVAWIMARALPPKAPATPVTTA
jgi:hypothetical protein